MVSCYGWHKHVAAKTLGYVTKGLHITLCGPMHFTIMLPTLFAASFKMVELQVQCSYDVSCAGILSNTMCVQPVK